MPSCTPLSYMAARRTTLASIISPKTGSERTSFTLTTMYKPLFDQLSKKEQEIIGRYFGVFGYEEMSAKDISELMLMTPNAINKSVNASLNKLKELYYKGCKLFYWRNANWGFKDKGVLYFQYDYYNRKKRIEHKYGNCRTQNTTANRSLLILSISVYPILIICLYHPEKKEVFEQMYEKYINFY